MLNFKQLPQTDVQKKLNVIYIQYSRILKI